MRPAQDDRTATVHWRRCDPSAIEVLSSVAYGLGRGTCFAWKTFFRHCDAGKRLIIAKPYQRYGRDDNQGPSSPPQRTFALCERRHSPNTPHATIRAYRNWLSRLSLLFGFLGVVVGGQISWLANLLIIPAWPLLLLHSKASDGVAFMFCVGVIVVGNAFLFQGVNTSEAGGLLQQVTSLGIGYWFWMGSITLSAVTAVHGVSGVPHRGIQ